MKKRSMILAALMAAVVLGAGIGSARAYFTTYAEAEGGCVVKLGDTTTLKEDVVDLHKAVSITSEDSSEPVWVRARAYYGEGELHINEEGSERYSSKWSLGADGWWYYSDVLMAGESTEVLVVSIQGVEVSEEDLLNPSKVEDFDVIVVYESIPVEYDENGVPLDPDWDARIDDGDITEAAQGDAGSGR